jgi:hypothetical protein
MFQRCLQVPLPQVVIFALGAMILVVSTGCGVLNPALVGAIPFGEAVNTLDSPEGYIAILLINTSPYAIETQLFIEKANGTSKTWTLSSAAADFYVLTQDCDIARISFGNFSYVDPVAGTVETPANLGSLTKNEGLQCGSVVAITAGGTPPTFTVNVY